MTGQEGRIGLGVGVGVGVGGQKGRKDERTSVSSISTFWFLLSSPPSITSPGMMKWRVRVCVCVVDETRMRQR